MRLPTITPRQAQLEDARAVHEHLWASHVAGTVCLLDPAPRSAKQFHDALRIYWRERGFTLRCKTIGLTDGSFRAWLEPGPGRAEIAS